MFMVSATIELSICHVGGTGAPNPRPSDYKSATLPLSYEGGAVTPRLQNDRINLMRVIEVTMERRRSERAGETGDPRENPPTNGIVRHDFHMRKSDDPAGD
ncbi:hypothetical protein PR048_000194 [Dryococelus australis]|uniref:Uncharacterized protein n=1 Tax=Dryococelus australis TaxID=614101 RepID=A0ABQ9IE00_9NEOP|nr:hypothetical protein PR048_000194 [Dryococelus australis]